MNGEVIKTDKNLTNHFLIGKCLPNITGNKLPSNRQVLSVLYFNTRVKKTTIKDGAKIAGQEAIVFWEKAALPTRRLDKIVEKIKKLYDKIGNLQKRAKNEKKSQKFLDFLAELDNLFDISHGNILDMIDEKKKKFLLDQRKKGIVGFISNVNSNEKKNK